MIKKIIQTISSINQFLLFIAAILIIALVTFEFVGSLNRNSDYEEDKVEIVQAEQKEDSPIKTVHYSNFTHIVGDTYVFEVMSTKIDPSIKHRSSSSSYGMGKPSGPSPSLVNIMFVVPEKPNYMLFEQNCLISHFRRASLKKSRSWDKVMSKNLYNVINEDSDNDGFLSRDDRTDFYVSDPTGHNLKLVLKDIEDKDEIADNKLLLTQGERMNPKYYLYDVVSDELSLLDTNIELTSE